jgi:hypothetical protein
MHRQRKRITTAALLSACLLLTGCFRSDPVGEAIEQLGGNDAERRKAAMALRLTSRDPVPQLIETVNNNKLQRRIRLAALEVLGQIARRQDDERVYAFLLTQLSAPEPRIRESAVEGFVGAVYADAVPALLELKRTADGELRRRIEEALAATAEKMARDAEKLWNSPEAAMREYQRLEELGLNRGPVGYSKARFLDMRGRYREAKAKYDELGVIRRYWLIGPFPNRQGMGFRQAYPPEKEINLDAAYEHGTSEIKWYKMDRDLQAGHLDFERFFVETDNVLAYTLVYLVSQRRQTVEVRAGSDDTLTLFLNGEPAWYHEQYRAVRFDDDVVDVQLEEGTNTLLFKVCEDWGAWHLIARITGPGDTALDGVTLTLEP